MKEGDFEELLIKNKKVDTNLKISENSENFTNFFTIKNVTDTLSDVIYLKKFNTPTRLHYEILEKEFFSSPEQTQQAVLFLEDFFRSSNKPLFSLLRYVNFLKNIINRQMNKIQNINGLSGTKESKKIEKQLQILYDGFKKIQKDPEVSYFLAKNIDPDYIMKSHGTLENFCLSVLPVFITNNYAVVDTGEQSFYILDIPENRKDYVKNLLEKYKEQIQQNNTLSKLGDGIQWGLPLEMEEFLIPLSDQVRLFPHIKKEIDFLKDEIIFEARSFFKEPIRGAINEDLNINLNNLSFQEQIYFLTYIAKKKNKDFESLKKFTNQFGLSGIRTFLSIEQGGQEMGDKIFALAEKLPKDIAEKVFAKYAEIVDSANEITNILIERFGKDNKNEELILEINENLLKKGKDLLLESATSLDKCEGDECKVIGLKIDEKLSHINKENILLGSTYKALIKEEGFKIESIKDVKLEMINSKNGIEKYKEELIRIFKDNRENYPEELLKESTNEFTNVLENIENKEFYLLKNKEEILAFMRFDILENGNYYAGSLNGRNEIKGLAIGGSFLKQLLINKSKERDIEAVVYEKNNMLQRYANEFGFKVVGEIKNYKGTGQKFFKLLIKKDSLE